MDLIDGCGIVNRKPDLSQNEIIQSVVFLRDVGWTYLKAIEWLHENNYYSDMADVKKSQIISVKQTGLLMGTLPIKAYVFPGYKIKCPFTKVKLMFLTMT